MGNLRHRNAWGDREKEIMDGYIARGWSGRRIASAMGRTVSAIGQKYIARCKEIGVDPIMEPDDMIKIPALPMQQPGDIGSPKANGSAYSVAERRREIHPMFREVMYRRDRDA